MLIIGIDGASWSVLDEAIKAQKMPFLAGLIKSGARAVLKSTNPPLTPAAWASFHMADNPGAHGVVDFVAWNKTSQQPELVDSSYLAETFWQRLEQKKITSTIVNVPMTYPASNLATQVVTGLLTPDVSSQWAYPHQLQQEILHAIPDYEPIRVEHHNAAEIEQNRQKFIDTAKQAIDWRTRLGKWFIRSNKQDVLMIQYQVIDWIQHAFWYGLDPKHTSFDSTLRENLFQSIYMHVDNAIAALVTQWQQSTQNPLKVLIVSDHGFQAHHKRILLGNYLYNNGVLDRYAGTKHKMSKILHHRHSLLKNKSPFELLGRSQWGFAYLYPEYNQQQLHQQLKPLLNQLKDPDTNTSVIKRIWLKTELYSGKKMNLLPDLLIEPADGYSVTAAIDKTNNYFAPVEIGNDFHIGIHHIDGVIATNFKADLPTHIEDVGKWIEGLYS